MAAVLGVDAIKYLACRDPVQIAVTEATITAGDIYATGLLDYLACRVAEEVWGV